MPYQRSPPQIKVTLGLVSCALDCVLQSQPRTDVLKHPAETLRVGVAAIYGRYRDSRTDKQRGACRWLLESFVDKNGIDR